MNLSGLKVTLKTLLTCFPFVIVTNTLKADELINDSGLWSQIEGYFKLDAIDPKLKRLRLWTVGEARFFDDFDRFSQGLIRILPGYQYNDNIALYFGYTWFPVVLKNGITQHEHDINQAINWVKQTDWGKLSSRTMIEWRFVDYDNEMATRLRQRVGAAYQFSSIIPNLSLVTWEELFINVYSVDWAESGFDQNRFFAGIGWQIDNKGHYRFEVGYLNQYISRPKNDDLMNHMLLSSLQINF